MPTSLWNSAYITNNITEGTAPKATHFVFLNLRAREPDSGNTFETNRIGLKAESIAITTSRTVPSMPIPGVGVVTGESLVVGLDLGMSSKTVNVSGTITEQVITKLFKEDLDGVAGNDNPTVTMTAFEVAQLIHSYVDSSRFQKQQNMSELIILIPSRVDHLYRYHDGLPERTGGALTSIENLPLIPFNYATRNQDNQGTVYGLVNRTTFAQPIHADIDIDGMSGFIRSFNTTLVPGQPFIDFTLDFEVAYVI